jgi:cell division transport system permease protein
MALRVGYYLKETAQGLRRNGLIAFAAVSTAFIALFLLGQALLVSREVDLIIQETTGGVEISVFLQKDVSLSQQTHIGELLSGMPEVASVHFESQQEAWENFKRLYRGEKALLENTGPESLPTSFRVKLRDPEKYPVVAARLTGQPGIDNIKDNREILNRLFAVIRVLRVWGISLAVVMLVSAAALIGNTVRLAVFNRRKEIGIMRLVGATKWHIRMPFLIEGIIEGLLGAAAAVLMLFFVKGLFIDNLRKVIEFLPFVDTQDVLFAAKWIFPLGAIVAAVGSLVAMRRFLEV